MGGIMKTASNRIYQRTNKFLKERTALCPMGGFMLGLVAVAPGVALANPTGGNVVGGSATIANTPDELQIHQSSDRQPETQAFDKFPSRYSQK